MTDGRRLEDSAVGGRRVADDVVAAWPLRRARALFQSDRLPEWLYKAAIKAMPNQWYPDPQSYILDTKIDGRAVRLLHRTNDTIGREAWLFGYYDRLVLAFLRDLTKRLKTTQTAPLAFYDIGANIGNHTVFLSDLFNHVYCFEPNPMALEVLATNVASHSNVQIFSVGLSDLDTELGFMTGGASNLGNAHIVATQGGQAPSIKVAVRNGDKFVRDNKLLPPTLIKIDVEGHEAEVAAGLAATIEAHTPVIVFEILERALGKAAPFAQMLSASGYRIFKMSGLGRARQLMSFRNTLVLSPYGFERPCENALAIPPRYRDVLQDMTA